MIIQLHTLTAQQLDNLQVAIDQQRAVGIGTQTDAVDCTPDELSLTDLVAQIKAVNERAKARGRDLLGKAFAAFFDRCPEVRAVVWTQYAPYFNDGDPCVFNVHEPEIVPYADKVEPAIAEEVASSRSEYSDNDEGDDIAYCHGEGSMLPWSPDRDEHDSQKRVRAAYKELLALAFTDACESIMQSTFGDDCKVVATRDGFAVGEYSHD